MSKHTVWCEWIHNIGCVSNTIFSAEFLKMGRFPLKKLPFVSFFFYYYYSDCSPKYKWCKCTLKTYNNIVLNIRKWVSPMSKTTGYKMYLYIIQFKCQNMYVMRLELFPATLTEKSAVCLDEQGINTYFTISHCTMCCIFKYYPVIQSTFLISDLLVP